MSWKIKYTAQAREDLRDIYEYIALGLLAPENAVGQTRRIMQAIGRNAGQNIMLIRGNETFSVDESY